MEKFLQYFGFGFTILTEGDGVYAVNPRGRRYLIANSGTWNFALGYGQEEIIQAVCEQMRTLTFSNSWGGTHPKAIELAHVLVELAGNPYAHAYLGSNGSEVTEMAFKLARQYHRQSPVLADRRRIKIISLRGCYHGYGYGAVSASGTQYNAEKYGPLLPGFLQIEPPYCYRCPFGKTGYPECNLACAQALEDIILEEEPETCAAFILEPILAEANVIKPPEAYYAAVGDICRKYGLLLIADEVTTGFGRAGKLLISQDWKIKPDVLCLGKIISGGYLPLSALLATQAVYERFGSYDSYLLHGSTHSGHPACAAAGLAAIQIIQRDHLIENAARVGAYLGDHLYRLKEKHALIGDVRGAGLMWAVELVKNRETKQPLSTEEELDLILDICEQGMLISLDHLRLFPPLVITEEIVDQMAKIIDNTLSSNRLGRGFRVAKEFLRSRLPA
jgi:adenosylmethionine-8-amino-7-oxononanoate aminotransferase